MQPKPPDLIKCTETLFVEIDETGAPDRVEIVQSLGPGPDEKALDAVKRRTFRPPPQNDQPVRCELVVAVPFQ